MLHNYITMHGVKKHEKKKPVWVLWECMRCEYLVYEMFLYFYLHNVFFITETKQGVKRRNSSSSSDSDVSSDHSTNSLNVRSHSHVTDKHRHKKKRISRTHKMYRFDYNFLFFLLVLTCGLTIFLPVSSLSQWRWFC